MIAIIGATGNTGSLVADKLLAQKVKVRTIGRDSGRLARFAQEGAEAIVAEATDAAALAKAFEGADGVYAMLPPNFTTTDPRGYQEKVSDALAHAIKQAGVSHVVALSSVGADKAEKVGPVVGLHNLEQKLNAIPGLNAVYVRAGYFMENTLPQIEVIRNYGLVGGPFRPDQAVSMIATRDIGTFAADLLLKRDFKGKQSGELLGPRDMNYKDVASVIGKAIGNPGLAYVQLPPQQLKPAFVQLGMSSALADLILEMAEAINSGYMAPLEKRSAANTTPTSYENFVSEVFLPRYQGKTATA